MAASAGQILTAKASLRDWCAELAPTFAGVPTAAFPVVMYILVGLLVRTLAHGNVYKVQAVCMLPSAVMLAHLALSLPPLLHSSLWRMLDVAYPCCRCMQTPVAMFMDLLAVPTCN